MQGMSGASMLGVVTGDNHSDRAGHPGSRWGVTGMAIRRYRDDYRTNPSDALDQHRVRHPPELFVPSLHRVALHLTGGGDLAAERVSG